MRIVVGLAILLLASAAQSAAHAEEIKVTMAGSDYAPAKVNAKVGDTLVFLNDDESEHNVFIATAGHATDFGKQKPGESAQITLAKPGTFDAECSIHANMRTVVEVVQ